MTTSVGVNSAASFNADSTFNAPESGTTPQFIVAVKKAVVKALKNTFSTPNYPDPILQNMSVSMEYPTEVENYPGVWVGFSFKDMQSLGIGNPIFTDPGPPVRRYQLWNFGGTVTMTIVALTSKERDAISDKIIQMYAFHKLNAATETFVSYLKAYPYIYMSINNDILRTEGESTTVGAPWQPDVLVYENSISFDLLGQFASQLPTGDLLRISELRPYPYGTNEVSTALDDGLGTWIGEFSSHAYDSNNHPEGRVSDPFIARPVPPVKVKANFAIKWNVHESANLLGSPFGDTPFGDVPFGGTGSLFEDAPFGDNPFGGIA